MKNSKVAALGAFAVVQKRLAGIFKSKLSYYTVIPIFVALLVIGLFATLGINRQSQSDAAVCTVVPGAPINVGASGGGGGGGSGGGSGPAYNSGAYGAGMYAGSASMPSAPVITKQSVKFGWSPSGANACEPATYNVYLKDKKIASSPTSSYSVTGLAPGAMYSFSVTALDASGRESLRSSAYAIKTLGILGDSNGDDKINGIDLSMLLSHDGQDFPATDFNVDHTVAAADLAVMLAGWTW
jgi:hypothetical protein